MKFIGQMKDGSRLVIIAEAELDALVEQAAIISSIVLEINPEDKVKAPVPRKPIKREVATGLSKAKSRAKRSRDKKCVICKKKFHDGTKTNTRKACSVICKKAMNQQAKNASHGRRGKWETRYKALPAINPSLITSVNPADPFLTQEQRKKLSDERLAGIIARQP